MHHGRPHEIAETVAPRAAEPPAPRGLALGDQPVALADMPAAGQPRQQVGVGRTCLRYPLAGRGQNSTAAALAETTASTGMKRQPMTERSEDHTSELQALMRTSSDVFCLKQ